MNTTQWLLVMNTMYSFLPRSTAAQAYRAYLGLDISERESELPPAVSTLAGCVMPVRSPTTSPLRRRSGRGGRSFTCSLN